MAENDISNDPAALGRENRSGKYPFPLTDGASESPYLTWIRHHSNYMALRGPRDYLRSLGVLVRGILINLLVLAPSLLIAALVVSLLYSNMLENPYLLTKIVIGVNLLWVLVWPVTESIRNIIVYRRTLKFGSDSTVIGRDFYERTFGLWLILIVVVFAFESFPHVLTKFNEFVSGDHWRAAASGPGQDRTSSETSQVSGLGGLAPWLGGVSLGSIVALAAASNKLLSAMGGFRRKLLIAGLALLGFLVPFAAVLYIANYLIYYQRPHDFLIMGIWIVVSAGVALVIIALYIGWRKKAFAWEEIRGAVGILLTLLAMSVGGFLLRDHLVDVDMSADAKSIEIQVLAADSAEEILFDWDGFSSKSSEWSWRVEAEEANSNTIPTFKADYYDSARAVFDALVIKPLEDMANTKTLARELKDFIQRRMDIENFDSYFARYFDAYEESEKNDGDLSQYVVLDDLFKDVGEDRNRLSELYIGVFNGYNYSFSKSSFNKSGGKREPAYPENYFKDFLSNPTPEIYSLVKGDYWAFWQYHDAFLAGLEEIEIEFPGLLSAMRNYIGSHSMVYKANRGLYGRMDPRLIERGIVQLESTHYYYLRVLVVISIAAVLWAYCWFVVDINSTSIHALYRDRLASTFLIGIDTEGDIGIENDIDLEEICSYAAGSMAPYHLVNAALNLQGSKDIELRNRKCGFFIFSKRFTGGKRTGYCRSEMMEQVFPQMSLATAMAISAAAASPNMGRSTSPSLVAFMTMLNIRLGVWVPHPGRVEDRMHKFQWRRKRKDSTAQGQHDGEIENSGEARIRSTTSSFGFTFEDVFNEEVKEIEERWKHAYSDPTEREFLVSQSGPAVNRRFVGLALSGGGIRSATINLGITQALVKRDVFRHIDFMSTVSGGGYIGASISTLMRTRTRRSSAIAGKVSVEENEDCQVVTVRAVDSAEERRYEYSKSAILDVQDGDLIKAEKRLLWRRGTPIRARFAGQVTVVESTGKQAPTLTITSPDGSVARVEELTRFDQLRVKSGQTVAKGEKLTIQQNTFADRFRWRVRPAALLQEVFSILNADNRWVNLSDGGHIENLATFELLRRRCRFIIVGDGEADPMMHFTGLATLIRTARIDLGVEISIDLDDLCLDAESQRSSAHWAVGRIHYPDEDVEGTLLYLKSSCTGKEDASIAEYRYRNPTFPHESTANQFFVEDQFEAYRALGQYIAEDVLKYLPNSPKQPDDRTTDASRGADTGSEALTFEDFEHWFLKLAAVCNERVESRNRDVPPIVDGMQFTATVTKSMEAFDADDPASETAGDTNETEEISDVT